MVAWAGGLMILLALAMLFNTHHILGKSRIDFQKASGVAVKRAQKAGDIATRALSQEFLDHQFSKDGTSAADVAYIADVRGLMKDAGHLRRKPKNAEPGDPKVAPALTRLRQLMPPEQASSNERRLVRDTRQWNEALTNLAETAQALALQSSTDLKKDGMRAEAEAGPARHKIVEVSLFVLVGALLMALTLPGLKEKTGPRFREA
jgi:hypothetical protein